MKMLQKKSSYKPLLILIAIFCSQALLAEIYPDILTNFHDESSFPNGISRGLTPDILGYRRPHKKCTAMIYIAADNDLFYFAWHNIRQLAQSACENINIVVFLSEPGMHKKTQIYLIEKNKATLLNKDNQEKLNSGDPQTLIKFCKWAIESFPADDYFLDLWNHGTGLAEIKYKAINPNSLFVFNPSTLLLELDRSIRYLDMLDRVHLDKTHRGICFDDTYKSYLNNQDLEYALATICREGLRGQKLSIIGMDACLMAMVEIANICKSYAHIMVASQEVELGQGWRYDMALAPFANGCPSKEDFACHLVKAYQDAYANITSDFTLSAINLDNFNYIENNINTVSTLLLECLQNQRGQSVKNTIRQCRRHICFEEPSYIDLVSFYKRLLANTDKLILQNNHHFVEQLQEALTSGIDLVNKSIISNTAGSNLKHANGISIYFPEQNILKCYQKTQFAQTNQWYNLITSYAMM
jgi:hypothetical protein